MFKLVARISKFFAAFLSFLHDWWSNKIIFSFVSS